MKLTAPSIRTWDPSEIGTIEPNSLSEIGLMK